MVHVPAVSGLITDPVEGFEEPIVLESRSTIHTAGVSELTLTSAFSDGVLPVSFGSGVFTKAFKVIRPASSAFKDNVFPVDPTTF